MSKQKKEYDFFNNDIMKMFDQIGLDIENIKLPEVDKNFKMNDDEILNLDSLGEEINQLNEDEEIKGNKDFQELQNISMKLPQMLKNMEQILKFANNMKELFPKN